MRLEHPRPGQVPLLKKLWAQSFGDSPEFIDSFFETAYTPGRCLCIWEEKRVLAAAYWLDHHYEQGKLAYIYAVATAENARGRGLCTALMARLHELLAAQGYAGAVLVPAQAGLAQMYSKMGYVAFGGRAEVFAAAGEAVPLRPLEPVAYHRLRQAFLPQGGCHLGSAALAFLARHCCFAAGEDFLLAYALENGRLFAPELLGNSAAIPGILGALEAGEGTFRVPGHEPFAMFHALNSAVPPAYWGHAFD